MAQEAYIGDGRPGGDGRSPDALLAAAARCISRHGFERTRLRDVAREAGVSIGLLQHYFETRDALLIAAFQWSCEEFSGRWGLDQQSAAPPAERIRRLIGDLAAHPTLTQRAATWTEFCACAARYPQLRAAVAEVYAVWRTFLIKAVTQGTEQGDFAPTMPAADVADLLNALVDGAEMAIAVDADLMTGARFQALALSAAQSVLRPTRPGLFREGAGRRTAGRRRTGAARR